MNRGITDNINYIVNTYSDMLYRVAYQYTFDKSEAEDIMQETFLAMLKKSDFKDEEHLKAWLIRVAVNKSKDFLRSKRRKVKELDENIICQMPGGEGVEQEIEKLPPLDRNIIYLIYYEGYSAKEVAKMTGKSQNAINIRLSRAREKLKNILEEN